MKTYTQNFLKNNNLSFEDFINNAVKDGSMQFQLEAYTDGRDGDDKVYIPNTFGEWVKGGNHLEKPVLRGGYEITLEVVKTGVYGLSFNDMNGVPHYLDAQHLLRFSLQEAK